MNNLPLRSAIASAARGVNPVWPLESFIAINPVAELETSPFDADPTAARTKTRSLDDYLHDYRSGRITAVDLEAAVRERLPEFDTGTRVMIDGVQFSPAALAARDLTIGADSPRPSAATARLTGSPSPLKPVALSRLDQLTAKWIAAYLDPEPLWRMPARDEGFYGAFRALATHDPDLTRRQRRRLRGSPLTADDALATALVALDVPASQHGDVIKRELAQLPGWVAHIKWRFEQRRDIDLTSYLAVRFTLRQLLDSLPTDPDGARATTTTMLDLAELTERARAVVRSLAPDAGVSADDVAVVRGILAAHPPAEHAFTWQRAYEIHYRDALLGSLSSVREPASYRADVHPTVHPSIQLMFCIDPRSEALRRQLEHDPSVETFGVAGFFGVPIRFARFGARGAIDALPALLSPRHAATEQPVHPERAARHTARLRLRSGVAAALHGSENSVMTPFAFAEASGLLYGMRTLARTLAPHSSSVLRRRLAGVLNPHLDTTITISDAFTLDERVGLAETVLRMTGLMRFAPLVILTGHGSTTTNNLFESALQCGACGGNPGQANARAAAAIFNDPEVRARLAERGIAIPDNTVFVAAEHDTTTDIVEILDRHRIPESSRQLIEQFDRLQKRAGDAVIRERAAQLPGASPGQRPSRLRRRAHDWAEVYPEWGLAGNAAMVVGPRSITRGVDLGRRVFLHSYDARADPSGAGLESILTAPVVVAQWINHQYFFSALHPERFGAGTKTLHNAIGTLGVLAGGSGDLRQGLPWQSVGLGQKLVHEPMRLTVIVEAPLDRVGDIVSRNHVLRTLFDNGWLMMMARPDAHTPWYRYTPYGWRPWTGPDTEGANA